MMSVWAIVVLKFRPHTRTSKPHDRVMSITERHQPDQINAPQPNCYTQQNMENEK